MKNTQTSINKNALVTLAMLQTQVDAQRAYIDYFIPYFLQSIKQQYENSGKSRDVELDIDKSGIYVKEKYGLEIPSDVVTLIIARVRKAHPAILKKRDHKYFITDIESIPAQEENSAAVERGITSICDALIKFSEGTPLRFKDSEDALLAILEFLSEFSIETLKNIQTNAPLPDLSHRASKSVVLVALFIQHLSERDTENYENFSNIVKGYMLKNALLCLDITEKTEKIKTEFYLDTPLVLSLVGLNGDARTKSTTELFELIKSLGGKLRIFSHTFEEINNVFNSLGESANPYKPRKHDLTVSEILIIRENLETTFKRHKIKIIQTPTISNQKRSDRYQIGEGELGEMLEKGIFYTGFQAHVYDAKSVAAIHLLRRGNVQYKLEKVPSFVTDNIKFASVVSQFERLNNLGGRCSVITSFIVTNLLWLKKPMTSPNLPIQTVIAQSYSFLDDSKLWEKFLTQAEKIQQSGQMDEVTIEYLRGSENSILEILRERTLGDVDELENDQNVLKIAKEAENKIKGDAIKKADDVKGRLEVLQNNLVKASSRVAVILAVIIYILIASPIFFFPPEYALYVIGVLALTGSFGWTRLNNRLKNAILKLLNKG